LFIVFLKATFAAWPGSGWRDLLSDRCPRFRPGLDVLASNLRPVHASMAGVQPATMRRLAEHSGAEGDAMTTYILLMNWTEQGAKNVRDSPKRLDAAKKLLEEMGGTFKEVFLTMGDYDLVAICDAPDDAVAARLALKLGAAGNVRTRTLKAFPEAAYRAIINSLG
jgi:uncharacterized protein with GYD domain